MGFPPTGPKGKAPANPNAPTATPNAPSAAPQVVRIPHGDTYGERQHYADVIKDFSPVYYYYYEDGRWGVWQGEGKGNDVLLVEVWEGDDDIIVHPSRNRFHWVIDPEEKRIWHEKATGSLAAIMLALKHGHAPPRDALEALAIQRHGKFPSLSKDYGKSEDSPQWATVDNLIGYTSESEITWIFNPVAQNYVPHSQNLSLQSLPSVYYKQGHLTSDHPKQGNIGWTPRKGKPPGNCLFFGNVLKQYVV